MATLAESVSPLPRAKAAARPRFYLWLSLACLAIGVGGFAPTYWLQVPAGTFTGTPLMHIHALTFTGWLLLLVGQNWRIARGRIDHHRAWGLAGIALATAMLVVGYVTAIVGLLERYEQGYGDNARSFLIVPMFSVTAFFGFFVAAIANVRRPEWHKRFIFVATTVALMPAAARWFLIYRRGFDPGVRPGNFPPNPVNASLQPLAFVCLLIVAGMIYDWRTRGKPHPAWTIGLAVLAIGAVLRAPISETSAWLAFADWTTRIPG
jgi:uncharacterized membrane protein YozB (DUF420 family)